METGHRSCLLHVPIWVRGPANDPGGTDLRLARARRSCPPEGPTLALVLPNCRRDALRSARDLRSFPLADLIWGLARLIPLPEIDPAADGPPPCLLLGRISARGPAMVAALAFPPFPPWASAQGSAPPWEIAWATALERYLGLAINGPLNFLHRRRSNAATISVIACPVKIGPTSSPTAIGIKYVTIGSNSVTKFEMTGSSTATKRVTIGKTGSTTITAATAAGMPAMPPATGGAGIICGTTILLPPR